MRPAACVASVRGVCRQRAWRVLVVTMGVYITAMTVWLVVGVVVWGVYVSSSLYSGSLIVRNLCTLLGGESIYRAMGRIADKQNDLEFASLMIQTLNLILLTSAEVSPPRSRHPRAHPHLARAAVRVARARQRQSGYARGPRPFHTIVPVMASAGGEQRRRPCVLCLWQEPQPSGHVQSLSVRASL